MKDDDEGFDHKMADICRKFTSAFGTIKLVGSSCFQNIWFKLPQFQILFRSSFFLSLPASASFQSLFLQFRCALTRARKEMNSTQNFSILSVTIVQVE